MCPGCSGPGFAQSLLRSARLGGGWPLMVRAALARQVDRVGRALGRRSGIEMRAARRAADRLGAQVVLGGRYPNPCAPWLPLLGATI
jgi:hypothetical protein